MPHAKQLAGGLFAVLMAFLFIADASAQFPGSTTRNRGGLGESNRGTIQKPRPENSNDPVEVLEFRLGMLEEDLKLKPIQMKPWVFYADQARAAATDLAREHSPAQSLAAPNAVQQMNHAVDSTRNRLAALEDVADAAKTLYEVLSPEQRMLTDVRFPSIIPLIGGGTAQTAAAERPARAQPPRSGGDAYSPSAPRPQ